MKFCNSSEGGIKREISVNVLRCVGLVTAVLHCHIVMRPQNKDRQDE